MRYLYVFLAILPVISCIGKHDDGLQMWYGSPAGCWEEALPVGNGRLGAMVFGNTSAERIQFNENTLYSGEPERPLDIDVTERLHDVRRLLAEGRNDLAGDIMQKKWIGRLNEAYQPMGDLFIEYSDSSEVTCYRHSLDLSDAVVSTSFERGGTVFRQEVFASHPAQAIIVHLEADRPELDFSVRLSSPHPFSVADTAGRLTMTGKAPAHAQRRTVEHMLQYGTQRNHPEYFDASGNILTDKHVIYGDELDGRGMSWETVLVPLSHKGGDVCVRDGRIVADGCREVTLALMAATSYNGPDRSPGRDGLDPHELVSGTLPLLSGADYDALKQEHINDYSALFSRVSFSLPSSETARKLPTDIRLSEYHEGDDEGLAALLFQFGRYLMISGSRPGGQPLNLQGLWNDKVLPPWNSGYTLNINLPMNYWPAEVTNLSECHEPLFRLIGEAADRGRALAHDMYGLDGWALHHNISIWRETYPSDGFVYWFFWNMSGPWLCSHIWEHYQFTGDRDFLEHYYPVMKGSAEFCSGWLVRDRDGWLVTPVGTSPENAFLLSDGTPASVCEGPVMDLAIIRNLFGVTASAAEVLGKDAEFASELREKAGMLRPYATGHDGRLLEWDREYAESEPQHRHVSHLFGLYPGCDITPENPEIFEAARRSLEMRGNRTTGWSMAWKISLWSRLYDSDNAYGALANLISLVDPEAPGDASGGLYRNMLNALPFQIDGNFGAVAGMAEMLLQSHLGYIHLLPALPAQWESGSISGLKARGGYTVSMEWKDGHVKAEITASGPGRKEVRFGDKSTVLDFTRPGQTRTVSF